MQNSNSNAGTEVPQSENVEVPTSCQTIAKPNVRCIYGYKQNGNRYYWKRGASKNFTQGFKSKQDVVHWIKEEKQSGNLDWTAGFTIKLKNQDIHWVLEDKSGSEIKY